VGETLGTPGPAGRFHTLRTKHFQDCGVEKWDGGFAVSCVSIEKGKSTMTNEQEMITAAKERAARVGANGIVLSKIDEPSAGAKVAGMIFGVGVMRRSEILGIRTKE
jgi:hypothetical protein